MEAVIQIAAALRREFKLQPGELYLEWKMTSVGDVELKLNTQGVGSAVVEEPRFRERLTALRAKYAALSADLWRLFVGEAEFVASMPADAFADRMRAKVRRS